MSAVHFCSILNNYFMISFVQAPFKVLQLRTVSLPCLEMLHGVVMSKLIRFMS